MPLASPQLAAFRDTRCQPSNESGGSLRLTLLDSFLRVRQYSHMKAWLAAPLMAMTLASALAAEQSSPDDSSSPSASTSITSQAIVISEPVLVRNDELSGKKFKVSGFLVRPFKAVRLHKAGSAVASLFQAINPFSRENAITEKTRFEGELSTIAWSSSVGWRAGGSSFSNPITHEVGLTALSVSR